MESERRGLSGIPDFTLIDEKNGCIDFSANVQCCGQAGDAAAHYDDIVFLQD
jgi:hypothetical protein